MLDPPDRADAPALTNLAALLKDWGIEIGNNVVVDVSGMGQLLGTDVSVPVAAKYESHPITDRFNLLTAYPLARSVVRLERRRERPDGAEPRHDQPEQLGGNRHQAADDLGTGGARSRQGGHGRPGLARRRRVGPGHRRAAGARAGAPTPRSPTRNRRTTKPETRIAVFGDSDFVANRYLGIPGNRICSSTRSTGSRSRRT